jgi:hypothetical protein
MTIPYYTHSEMAGAPQFSGAAREVANALAACLVNGFNSLAPTSAAASGGVLTLNYGSAHGYEALVHIQISGASVPQANGIFRVATVPAGNQLTCAIPGLPNGAVGGTISTKVAGAGWTEPFGANSTTRVFRMGGGNMQFLRIVQAAGAAPAARGYEAMTGLSSGTGLFPTSAQAPGAGPSFVTTNATDSSLRWWALAGPKFFYFQSYVPGSGSVGVGMFGDVSEPVKAADTFSTLISDYFGGAASYMARSHTGVAGAVLAHVTSLSFPGGLASPSPISAGQRFLYGVPVTGVDVVRGLLPGAFVALPPAASGQVGVLVSSVTGISGRVQHLHQYLGPGIAAVALDEAWT